MDAVVQESRLKHFPVPLFAIVMGLTGLTLAFEKAHHILHYPRIFSTISLVVATILFIVISFFYLLKIVKYPAAFRQEFRHPIRMNFFPAISICFLLLSIAFFEVNQQLSGILWYIGAPMHLLFTIHILKSWFEHDFKMDHLNPAWFIPIVGNILVPLTGVKFGGLAVSQFFFSIGVFFWPLILGIILNRMIFHAHLQKKFLPTMYIFIAPAAVGFLAYYKMQMAIAQTTGVMPNLQLDFFAHMLFDIALFFTILLFSMGRSLAKLPFSITWWAYTFPMTAMATATIIAFKITHSEILRYLAHFFLFTAVCIILVVAVKTIAAAMKREICIEE